MNVRAANASQHAGIFIVRWFDANSVIRPRTNALQMDITGHIIKDKASLFLENTAFAVDPSTEYLYYDAQVSKFAENRTIPQTIRQYIATVQKHKTDRASNYSKAKVRYHNEFWENIAEDPGSRNKFLTQAFEQFSRLGADFFIPPVPIILNEGLLDITAKINGVSKEIALALGRKECASYFLAPATALRNASLLEKIKQQIVNASTRLNILKFKYLDLAAPGLIEERENYRELLLDLAYISKTFKNKCFMVLENYYQCFPSAVAGFDVVSSSITGYDKEHGRAEHPTFGKWIDPKHMVPVEFETLKKMFHNNRDMLPCHHQSCRAVTDIEHISGVEWNKVRREHCPLYYVDLMIQLARAVRDRNTDLAREKLANSQLVSLKTLINNLPQTF
jgi:hypothetical protein